MSKHSLNVSKCPKHHSFLLFQYDGIFNYSTCLFKNRSNHKGRSPKEGSIYAMSFLIRGKSILKVKHTMLIHSCQNLPNIFILLTETWNLLPQSILQHSQVFFLIEGMPKAGQRFRYFSSTYHPKANQNSHKIMKLIYFQNSNSGKTAHFGSVGWDFIVGTNEQDRGQAQEREHKRKTLCFRI